MREYVLRVLKELISIPTVNPPGSNYDVMARYLARELSNLGLNVEVVEVPEEFLDANYPCRPQHVGRPRYLVLSWLGRGSPLIQVNCHYDVVPPGPGWASSPFTPKLSNDVVIGRGASDMKGGIAAALATVKELVDGGLLDGVGGRLELLLVPDEEAGGLGTRYYVEEVMGSRPDYVVIPEPTSVRKVIIGHKGVVKGLVRVRGRQAHASTPWLGVNAFVKAADAALKIDEWFRRSYGLARSTYRTDFAEGSGNTLVLGGFAESLSGKESVVPGEFVFSFDARLIPEVDVNNFTRDLEGFAELVDAGVEVLSTAQGFVNEGSRISAVIRECARGLGVGGVDEYVSVGRVDISYYGRVGVDAVAYGPGNPREAHASNEGVSLRDIEAYVKVLKCVVLSILGGP
ncbi:MAG: hypothetical protein B6U73_04740 [Desulfurococcales archaeon ex4484_204]|nr:MAG: hypothetical protein B6U73_04740 [Desulfurococcales archaeon ex4484_204]